MPKPVSITIDFLSFEGTTSNDPADSIRFNKKVEEADVSEVFRRQEAIADSTVDQVIALPDVATDYLIISVDQIVTIKLNGSSDALTLSPKSAGVKTPVFYIRGIVSAMRISNSSGSVANVDIISVNI